MRKFGKSLEEQIYERYQLSGKYRDNISRQDIYDIINKLLLIKHNDSKNCLTPLNIEIAMNNKEEVIKLLENGKDINEVNSNNLTPLAEAIYLNYYDIAEFLIKNGASLEGNDSFNPLFVAAINKNYRMIELLLKNNANANQLDVHGFNALHHLFNNGSVRYLKAQTPRYSLTFVSNYINRMDNKLSVYEQQLKCINLLYEYGIDVNYSNEIEYFFNLEEPTTIKINPLSLALESSNSKVLGRLIELGAERTAIELSTHMYDYQDSFNFIADIMDGDISCWIDAPGEYINYLKYMHKIRKYDIDVFTGRADDGYRRSKLIKKLEK